MSDTSVVVTGTNFTGNFYPTWVPDADDWNRLFGSKVDAVSGYLTQPTVYGDLTLTQWPTKPTDGTSKAYVDAILGDSNSLPDAPADGVPYCRANNGWVASPTTLTGNVGGDMNVGGNLNVAGVSILAGEVLIGTTVFSGYALDMVGAVRASGSGTFGANASVLDDAGNLWLAGGIGAFGATPPPVQPAFTGAKAGNTALASVIAVLVAAGFGTDATTA